MSASFTGPASRRSVLGLFTLMAPALIGLQACATGAGQASSASGGDAALEASADAALRQLLAQNEAARTLARDARGILVLPEVAKGGLIFGAQYGKGVLKVDGRVSGYYQSTGVSYGLQAGVEKYSYALFFMTDEALDYLHRSGGWEIGTGPTVVIVDEGISKQISTMTAREGVYAFVWGQRGLMAGIGLHGTKITRLA